MNGKLIQYGDSLALVLDQAVLEQLKIDADTSLELIVEGDTLIVSKAQDEARRAAFQASIEDMDRQYSEVFRRLAE